MEMKNGEKFIDIEAFKSWAKDKSLNPDDVSAAVALMMDYFGDVSPTVQVSQKVWVVNHAYPHYKIREGTVSKVQLKKRYTFVVNYYPCRPFTSTHQKGSIGKTVFFTREEAEEALRNLE